MTVRRAKDSSTFRMREAVPNLLGQEEQVLHMDLRMLEARVVQVAVVLLRVVALRLVLEELLLLPHL